ncbi:MAG: hypothetical protein ED859_01615 [Desulfuromonadales bacterium]|nr:MAG: hypothetical protein ED859_01615 [Desulfuromonadales bacterium]
MGIQRGVAVCAFGLCCLVAREGAASMAGADRVVVIKSERRLMLLKNGEVLKSYEVALGKEPVGHKRRQGDKRTPEGVYVLDRRNAGSRFHRSIHISYPNRDDILNARKQGVAPGGDVMIHGLPKGMEKLEELHTVVNWTNGCIAVTNAEMDEIWRHVPDGTPIEIRP